MNVFGKICIIINYIFDKDYGYPPSDSNILKFMLLKPSTKVEKTTNKLLEKITIGSGFLLKTEKQLEIRIIILY